MALTQGAWTTKTVNGKLVFECDVLPTTAEHDSYTLKTPDAFDPGKPFILMVNTTAGTLDGSALPVDIWGGYSDDFVLAGDEAVTATDGGEIRSAVIDDVKSTQISILVDPNYTGAAIPSTLAGVRGIVNAGKPAYFAFNLDGASTLAAVTCHFVIVQG